MTLTFKSEKRLHHSDICVLS